MLLNDRDQIIAMTAEWTGERYPNGRPRVSDEKIEILKNLTQEEIWQPLYSCGYRFQFQGDLKPLHPDKKLYGRAVTCCFMPQRPDLRQHVFNVARSRGWKGDCNQWVIDSLEESDVVVCDLYDKILRGTFVGGNLTTAVKARTKNGGVVVWGGVRDLEQMLVSPGRSRWLMVRWPRTWGYRPVKKLHRLGTQTGFWQYACPKDTASWAAKASRLGVMDAGLPRWASASPRISSGLKIMMCGCFAIQTSLFQAQACRVGFTCSVRPCGGGAALRHNRRGRYLPGACSNLSGSRGSGRGRPRR